MYKELRFWLAVLLSPFSAVVVTIGLVAITSENPYMFQAGRLIEFSILVLIFAYAGTIVIGIPTHLLLRHFKRNSLAAYATAGGAIASLPLIFLLLVSDGSNLDDYAGTILIGFCGLVVASTFWLIANWPTKPAE